MIDYSKISSIYRGRDYFSVTPDRWHNYRNEGLDDPMWFRAGATDWNAAASWSKSSNGPADGWVPTVYTTSANFDDHSGTLASVAEVTTPCVQINIFAGASFGSVGSPVTLWGLTGGGHNTVTLAEDCTDETQYLNIVNFAVHQDAHLAHIKSWIAPASSFCDATVDTYVKTMVENAAAISVYGAASINGLYSTSGAGVFGNITLGSGGCSGTCFIEAGIIDQTGEGAAL